MGKTFRSNHDVYELNNLYRRGDWWNPEGDLREYYGTSLTFKSDGTECSVRVRKTSNSYWIFSVCGDCHTEPNFRLFSVMGFCLQDLPRQSQVKRLLLFLFFFNRLILFLGKQSFTSFSRRGCSPTKRYKVGNFARVEGIRTRELQL